MAHQRARLYDRVAERYDRSRPSYPDALVDHLVGPSPEGLAVLDVACGTGIAACLMAQRGAQVLGVEGDPAMAAVAARHGIAVEVAEFERWEPAGRTFDLVTCAQAWHWLDVGAAAAKAASVLRPGGRLCVFWTVGFHPGDLDEALAATYRAVLPPDGGGLAIGCASNDAAHAAASAMENTPSATNCSPPACSTRPRRANSVGGGTTPGNCGSTSSPRTATTPHSSRGGGSRSWPQSGRRSTVSGRLHDGILLRLDHRHPKLSFWEGKRGFSAEPSAGRLRSRRPGIGGPARRGAIQFPPNSWQRGNRRLA